MRLTRRLAIAILIAVSMLAACNGAVPPSAASPPAGSSLTPSPSAGSSLTGRPWALTAVTGKTPAFKVAVPDYQQPDYAITFNTDGTYSGTAACNQIAGTFATSGDSLTITAGASQLVFCPVVAASDFGTIFAHSLTGAATSAVTNDTLTITLNDGGTMTFGPPQAVPSSARSRAVASLAPGVMPPAELLGKTWKLTGITAATPAFQGVVPEADQPNYTIEFQAEGTFDATADCNQVGGTYGVYRGDGRTDIPLEPEGGSISILPGPSTLAACPPGSLADLYVIGLSNASDFTIDGNQLTVRLGDEAATLVFTA
jgi:heat shock protein HslJ